MKHVVVYRFTLYDIKSDQIITSQRAATLKAISKMNGTAIELSATKVSEELIDAEGFLGKNRDTPT